MSNDNRSLAISYTLTHLQNPRDYVLQVGHKTTLVDGVETDEWMVKGKARLTLDTLIIYSVLACEDELNWSVKNLTTTIMVTFVTDDTGINVELDMTTKGKIDASRNYDHLPYFNKLSNCIKERARDYVLNATEDGQPDNQSTQPVKH